MINLLETFGNKTIERPFIMSLIINMEQYIPLIAYVRTIP